jgi:hypothetical protein
LADLRAHIDFSFRRMLGARRSLLGLDVGLILIHELKFETQGADIKTSIFLKLNLLMSLATKVKSITTTQIDHANEVIVHGDLRVMPGE